MSLSRALSNLSDDDHTKHVLRDVLRLFEHHRREWLTEGDVQSRTGRPRSDIHDVLPALSDAYVLDFDRSAGAYRFSGDVALEYEIGAFMRRVECQQSHVRTNLERFRERQGH